MWRVAALFGILYFLLSYVEFLEKFFATKMATLEILEEARLIS